MSCSTSLKSLLSKSLFAAFAACALLLSTGSRQALAFPELARHGYVNCTACHVSPTGGGVLNPYGRELSRELLSFRSGEREHLVLHGLIPDETLPPQISIGGDVRAIQTYRDTLNVRQGMFLVMQAEVEVAARPGRWTFDGTLGRITDGTKDWIGTHRFWGGYSPTDETMVRAGLFYPAFGLNIPEHFLAVRRGMGFEEGMETDNLELSWLGEGWSAYLTAGMAPGQGIAQAQRRDTTYAFQLNRHLGESTRVGVSLLQGTLGGASGSSTTQAAALHATIGISRKVFALGEVDGRWTDGNAVSNRYLKLGYEPVRGWVLGAFNDATAGRDGYGLTAQLFPRPHFQMDVAAEKNFTANSQPGGDLFGWLLLHYYL